MTPATGPGAEEHLRSLPDALRCEILNTLEELPPLATQEGRKILIVSAELGVELEDRIEKAGELERYCELLLDQLAGFGRLPDGRHPLEAVLKAARRLAGPRDYEDYDLLLRQVYAWLAGEAFPRVPERGRRRPRKIEAVGDWWVSSDEILHYVREEEIAKIRESLESVPQSDRAHVCLLFGGWGVGKTALLKLLASSLAEERFSLFSWLKGRTQRKILVVPHAGAQVEPLILRIYRAFSEEEQRKFLGDFRKRLRKHQEGLRSLIEAKTSVDSEPDLRGELMNLVEPGGLMLLDLLSGTTGTAMSPDLVAGLLRVSPSVSQKLGNWLKSLSREDLGSLSEIRRNLASALARDLAKMSRKHAAFVLAIDGYDACTLTCNQDLLDLVRYAGPRVFWIFAGRFEHPLNSSFKLLKESLHARFNEIPLLPLTEKEIFDLLERIQHRTVHRTRTAAPSEAPRRGLGGQV